MRLIAALPCMALLAGCASPYERCLAPTVSQLATVDTLLTETEANIARGFALERRQQVAYETFPCDDGDGMRLFCHFPVVVETRHPVAIDRDTEAGKLATLRARRSELAAEAVRAEARCRAEFPEG